MQLQALQVIRSHQALLSCPPCRSQHSNQVHLLQRMGIVMEEQSQHPPSGAMQTLEKDLETDEMESWAFNAAARRSFSMLLAASTPSCIYSLLRASMQPCMEVFSTVSSALLFQYVELLWQMGTNFQGPCSQLQGSY